MIVKNFLSSFDSQYARAARDAGEPRSGRGELLDRARIAGEHTCYGYFQGFAVYLMTRSTEKEI